MNQLLTKAIGELQYLQSGEIFLVKDLFKGYEWNRMELPERLTLGHLFKDSIVNNPNLGVQKLDKTGSKQQRYKKI